MNSTEAGTNSDEKSSGVSRRAVALGLSAIAALSSVVVPVSAQEAPQKPNVVSSAKTHSPIALSV
jgi:hypothetical protein